MKPSRIRGHWNYYRDYDRQDILRRDTILMCYRVYLLTSTVVIEMRDRYERGDFDGEKQPA